MAHGHIYIDIHIRLYYTYVKTYAPRETRVTFAGDLNDKSITQQPASDSIATQPAAPPAARCPPSVWEGSGDGGRAIAIYTHIHIYTHTYV